MLLATVGLGCSVEATDTAAACAGETELRVAGDEVGFTLADCASAELTARVVGDGDLSLRLESADGLLTPVVVAGTGGGVFRALALEGTAQVAGAEPARWWRQGYQSWSWAGVVELDVVSLDADRLPIVGGEAENTSFLADRASTSWWAGLLGRPGGAALLVGALAARSTPFYAAAEQGGALWLVWGGFGEEIALEPNAELALDPVWLDASADPHGLWVRYAQRVGAELSARTPALPPSVGWSSWYSVYAEVTEQGVRDNLAAAVASNQAGARAPIRLLQVDDGWQQGWGAWTANDKFPAGMAALAQDIADAGLQPGLWMAPFYVSRQTDAYREHRDWWVQDLEGNELAFDNDSSGDYAVIDVTHPDAAAWLSQQISARAEEGWTYLKLDFLYAGAQVGLRHEQLTALEAYARGVELLRQAAGDDSFILACGAPMLPSVGFADAWRTGADIAYAWDPEPEPAYLRWQARSTAARAWMNGRWWWNDPDVLLVREPFDLGQGRGAVVAQAVSGGLWLSGDDLSTLDDERLDLALNAQAAALAGLSPRPLVPLAFASGHDLGPVAERQVPDDRVPWMWSLGDTATALLNLGHEAVTLPGPGGLELFSGQSAAPGGVRRIEPGEGEIWLTADPG